MHSLQDDLDRMVEVWDSHLIRPSRNDRVPHGRPNIMHSLPGLYGTRDYKCPVLLDDIEHQTQHCVFRENIPCDSDIFEVCHDIMMERGLDLPQTPEQCLDLYHVLRDALHSSID